jgi:uncharacterized DUF497 family protein
MAVNREFEWDSAKAASNLAKHGVSFEAAARLFAASAFVDVDASQPGAGEIRRKAIGVIDGRVFIVVYTMRNQVTRIISARRGNAKETRFYDESTLHPRSE